MPFVGDRDWRLMDYRATWPAGGRTVEAVVTWQGDEDTDTNFVAAIDGVPHPIDDEMDLLDLAPPAAVVTFERGGVSVSMWRRDGRLHAQASAVIDGTPHSGTVATGSPTSDAIEGALYALGETEPSRAAPRVCFFCTHSDYEPHASFGGGHLACFVQSAGQYHASATSPSVYERKWGPWRDLCFRWVDELDSCAAWQRRPPHHGYRG